MRGSSDWWYLSHRSCGGVDNWSDGVKMGNDEDYGDEVPRPASACLIVLSFFLVLVTLALICFWILVN